jgi:tetratricopeptide (TPR) repeat protein
MLNPKQILSELERIRSDCNSDSSVDILPSIKYLQDLLATATLNEKSLLLNFLAMEYARYGMWEKEEGVVRQLTVLFPNNPASWVGLAEHLVVANKSLDEAVVAAQKAIEVANEQNALVRYSLNAQARVARKICDYSLLEETIKKLIIYKPNNQDIGYERDFLINLPEGAINQNLLDEYERVTRP